MEPEALRSCLLYKPSWTAWTYTIAYLLRIDFNIILPPKCRFQSTNPSATEPGCKGNPYLAEKFNSSEKQNSGASIKRNLPTERKVWR